jgi:ribose transport system permease protein
MGRLRLDRLPIDPAALPALSFLVLLILLGSALSDVFFSPRNTGNVLTNITPLLLIAIGQTFVIGSRGLDLSVGVTATLTATLVATLTPEVGPLAVPLAIGAAVIVGVVNGAGVRWGLNPFLMTLASLSVVQGLVFTYRTSPGGTVPEWLSQVAGSVGPVPIALPIAVLVAGGAAFVMRWTRLGAHLLASGGHPGVARLAGVRVGRSMMAAYVICSTLAGLAGLFLAARTRTGDPLIGQSFTLDSVAAVVLGGSLLAGGRVTIAGTVIGTICLGLLPNVLNLTAVPYFYQQPVKGLLLIVAVLLPALVHQVQQRRGRARAAERISALNGAASGSPAA